MPSWIWLPLLALGFALFGLLARWAARRDPRRFRIIAPWVYLSVGGALCLGVIVAAGLRLGDFQPLIGIGTLLLVGGVSVLALPMPPGEDEGGEHGDARDDAPD